MTSSFFYHIKFMHVQLLSFVFFIIIIISISCQQYTNNKNLIQYANLCQLKIKFAIKLFYKIL